MLKPGGIIQRIAREPAIHLEYLEADNPDSKDPAKQGWTDDEDLALFFDDYHDADLRAHELGGRPIFAITRPARVVAGARDLFFSENGDVTEITDRVAHRRHRIHRRHVLTGSLPNAEVDV